LLLVAGEAGSGKTALVQSALGSSAAALTLHWGDAPEFGNSEFGPIKDLLRRLRLQSAERYEALGREHAALASLLPADGPCHLSFDRESLFDAVADVLLSLGHEAPAALVFDDLHAADHASIELLARLSQRMHEQRVLLVAAYRSDDLTRQHPLRRLRQQWRKSGRAIEIELLPLDETSALALLATRLGRPPEPTLAAQLVRLGGGLPLYLEALADAVSQPRHGPAGDTPRGEFAVSVPASLQDAVMLRLGALDPAAQRLLERAAVAGDRIDLDLLPNDVDAGWLDQLFDARWLVEVEPGVAAFRHALLREVVYGQIPWTRRRRWHRAWAESLDARGGPIDLVAEHWLAAHDGEPARGALLALAQRACSVHAYADALASLNRALELWPAPVDEAGRLAALYQLGNCAQLAGRTDEAARAWTELRERGEHGGDWQQVGRAQRRLAVLWSLGGDWTRAVQAREAAAQAFLRCGQRRDAASEWCTAAELLNLGAQHTAVLDLVERALPLAREMGDLDLEVHLLSQRGRVLARMGRQTEGLADAQAAMDLVTRHTLTSVAGVVYQRLADCHERASDYARARQTFLHGVDLCEANGDVTQRDACKGCVLPVLFQTGEWDLGERLAAEIMADPRSPGWAQALARVTGGQWRLLRGSAAAARDTLTDGLRRAQLLGYISAEASALQALAQADAFDGRDGAGREHAHAALDRWATGEERHHIVHVARSLSSLFVQWGDVQGVSRCVQAVSVAASATGQREALSGLAHALAEQHMLAGRPIDAAREFASSLKLLDGLLVVPQRAAALERYAEALLALGDGTNAALRLREAIDLWRSLGAMPLLQAAIPRLRAVAPAMLTAADERHAQAGLTPRQIQILHQIATGSTDKQIARELALSPRTVEMHVGRLLAALQCRSRAEAVRRAAELRLLG